MIWNKKDALLSLLCNFALENVIWKNQEHQKGLEMNRTLQVLVYAYNVNLLGTNMNTIQKNMKYLLYSHKEAGLEVNTE
jgi:hypothetical protein